MGKIKIFQNKTKNKKIHVFETDIGYIVRIFDLQGTTPSVHFKNPKGNYRINEMHLSEHTIEAMYYGMLKLKEEKEL